MVSYTTNKVWKYNRVGATVLLRMVSAMRVAWWCCPASKYAPKGCFGAVEQPTQHIGRSMCTNMNRASCKWKNKRPIQPWSFASSQNEVVSGFNPVGKKQDGCGGMLLLPNPGGGVPCSMWCLPIAPPPWSRFWVPVPDDQANFLENGHFPTLAQGCAEALPTSKADPPRGGQRCLPLSAHSTHPRG